FVVHWTQDVRNARATHQANPTSAPAHTRANSDTIGAQGRPPEDAIERLLTGYHALDPMQRTAKLRAALALLDAFDSRDTQEHPSSASMRPLRQPHDSHTDEAEIRRSSATALAQPTQAHGQFSPSGAVSGATHVTSSPAPVPLRTQQHHPSPSLAEIRPEDAYLLDGPVTAIPGVGATQAERLARLGVSSVRDLLMTFPREHRDYSALKKIAQLPFDEVSTTIGLIWDVTTTRTKGGRSRTVARITDETGPLYVSWFNQPYLQKQLTKGAYIVVTGIKQRFGNRVEMSVRSHELPEQGDLINTGRLVPVYPLTEGLHPKALRRFTKWAVDHCASFLPDALPPALRMRARLEPLPEAIAQIHYPDNAEALARARRRLAFDELFLIQMGMLTKRANWRDGAQAPALPIPESLIFAESATSEREPIDLPAMPTTGLWPMTATCFETALPFRFTGAQRRAIREILADLRHTEPMSRLLQGDVGSGKTVVAAAALLAAAANGYQGALLAPTEILAEQHYRGLIRLLEPFGLLVVLLTGSQRARERTQARDALANGQAAVAIGTHALIQEDVAFHRLGLAIVDEQHRFGVEQREALRRKGQSPHMLVMTATPIPRTLALSIYGDLDVSVLDELPAGRQPIITRWRAGRHRHEAYALVEQEVAAGRQAYVICPLVEESEALEAKSAIAEYERLRTEVFPHLRLGLVHGQLRPAEKDRVMRAFRDGELDVLVATAVVEVGVDVPNATVMIIEDADRFGLSQLHQFRGRVGRGDQQSYCYLLSQEASAAARER
ncbi:MAG TPA: ATP-dependent DNA helicase RecG, partial [Ktedonobacterales bacterium]|nr:ATP-dependent DNA helicase RecG [Ktedonobacterales bacterium]